MWVKVKPFAIIRKMRFALALVVACMAFQTISASPSPTKDVDLVTIVKDILKVAVEGLDTVYEKLDEIFTKYTENEKEENQKVVNAVEKIGYEITEDIVKEIEKLFDDMEPTANANGKQAMTCIRNEKQHVFTAVNSSVDAITECILGEVPLIIQDGTDMFVAYKGIIDTLKTADKNLENCKLGEVCLIQLLSDLAKLKLDDFVKGVKELVKGVQDEAVPAWVGCFKTEKVNILKNVVDIFDETIDCIDA